MTDENELLICINCVKEIRLKKLVKKNNFKGVGTCCGKIGFIINTASTEFTQMIKALIRYHFSEWDYNTHFGGVNYGTFFYDDDNIFFNKQNFTNDEVYDDLVNNIECLEVYEDYEKGVSLFAGYSNFDQLPLLRSIKTDLDFSIKQIEGKLKEENYFNFEEQISQILSFYKSNCRLILNKGKAFYRARVGFENKKRSLFEGGFEGEMVFIPYSHSQMGAPPPNLAGCGRINRAGVSYLYCATDKYTAISEIRPHPGDIVSIGKFILTQDASIFDLGEEQFLNYYKSDSNLDKFKKLNTFTELMQKVVPPSERQAYNITQLIADCIRKLDFDGILFPSSVGDGYNIVIFNPAIMKYTYDDSEIIEIKKVNYKYIKRLWKKDISEIE